MVAEPLARRRMHHNILTWRLNSQFQQTWAVGH